MIEKIIIKASLAYKTDGYGYLYFTQFKEKLLEQNI